MTELRQRHQKSTPENADSSNLVEKPKKGKCIGKLRMLLIVVTLWISVYLFFIPSPIIPVARVPRYPLPHFDGVMKPNEKLTETAIMNKAKLLGPESIQVDLQGNIYTGLADGRVVKIEKSSGNIEVLIRTGDNLPDCGKDVNLEEKCGRPLGLHLDIAGEQLFICDAYKGLLLLHLPTKVLTTLLPSSLGVGGVPFKLLNSVVMTSDGVLYFTDSSTKWNRKDFPYILFEGRGDGRLMSYNLKTKETNVLLDGLLFANGVALSPNEDFVLCVETGTARIFRVWLEGEKKGTHDIFIDNLPGIPDNIRNANGGGYWVAFATKREHPFSFLDAVGPYPSLKSFLAKVVPKNFFHWFIKNYGLIVKIGEDGELWESYHDTTGQVISHISEVYDHTDDGVLYLGSYTNSFLGMLRLNQPTEEF